MTDENTNPESTGGGKKTSNKIELRGNLASEVTFTPMGDDKMAARFAVATAESYKKGDEWKERAAEFTYVNITNQAQVTDLQKAVDENGFGKGKQIAIEGSVNHRNFEKNDGSKGYSTEVVPRNGQTAVKTEFDAKDYRQVNKAEITGYLAQDPEFGKTGNGSEFMNMRVVTDYGYKNDKDEWVNSSTTHTLTSYNPKQVAAGKVAQESGELGTGALVSVMGRQQTRVVEGEGGKQYYPDLAMRGGEAGFKVLEASKASREAAKAAEPEKKSKGDDPEIPF